MRRGLRTRIVIAWLAASAPLALAAPHARADEQAAAPDPFRAKLAENARRAAKAGSALATVARRAPPKGLGKAERKAWAEQSRYLAEASSRFLGLKAKMDAVLAKAKAPPSEMAQMSLQLTALEETFEAEAARWSSAAGALRARHETAVSAIKNAK